LCEKFFEKNKLSKGVEKMGKDIIEKIYQDALKIQCNVHNDGPSYNDNTGDPEHSKEGK
jgi:hypothetical protein